MLELNSDLNDEHRVFKSKWKFELKGRSGSKKNY